MISASFDSRPLITAILVMSTIHTTNSSSIAGEVTITSVAGKAVVKIDGALFTEYIFEGHAKPILYPIVGPHGIEMTRNYPMVPDSTGEAHHPHHKSLWFSHDDVNGVQFWMEYPRGSDSQPGKIVQEEIHIHGNHIQTENNWVAPDGKIVCSDTRDISFGATAAARFIDYGITLHASQGDVVFGDTKEGTMGVRTHPLLRLSTSEKHGNHTAKGQAVNSEGDVGGSMWGKRAKWVDYWAPIGDHTVGIAIFDHPTNPRHPTWWHARTYGLVAANPFGIHNFEGKPEGTGDMTIKSNETVTFRYRFLFHEGDSQQANIPAEYKKFSQIQWRDDGHAHLGPGRRWLSHHRHGRLYRPLWNRKKRDSVVRRGGGQR